MHLFFELEAKIAILVMATRSNKNAAGIGSCHGRELFEILSGSER